MAGSLGGRGSAPSARAGEGKGVRECPAAVLRPQAPCAAPEHHAWLPSTSPLTKHWLQLRPVTSRLQRHSPLTGSHWLPSATVPRGSHWHPAQRASGVRQGQATRPTPAGAAPVPTLAALRIGGAEAEEARFAAVTTGTSHVLLAAALPRDQPPGWVVSTVAQPPVQRALGIAVTGWGHRQGQQPDPPVWLHAACPAPHTPQHRPRHTAGSRRSLLGSL